MALNNAGNQNDPFGAPPMGGLPGGDNMGNGPAIGGPRPPMGGPGNPPGPVGPRVNPQMGPRGPMNQN